MEPISSLLDAFIKLADRIINLEKSKLQDKQSLFNEISKPLFEELEPVALNYIEFFRKARKTISNSSPREFEQMAIRIKEEREEMIVARIKVREMAKKIKEEINHRETIIFAEAINDFFYAADKFPDVNFEALGTRSTSFIAFLKFVIKHKIGKEHVIDHIDIILEGLELSWASVVQAYEQLRINSLTLPKFLSRHKAK